MSKKPPPHPRGCVPKSWSAIFAAPCVSTISPGTISASSWNGSVPMRVLKILESRGQRVSLFQFPYLLQSPNSRTELAPQATT